MWLFTKKIFFHKQSKYDIVYLDETWVNKKKSFVKKTVVAKRFLYYPNIPSGKGKQLVILHVGSCQVGSYLVVNLFWKPKMMYGITIKRWMEMCSLTGLNASFFHN